MYIFRGTFTKQLHHFCILFNNHHPGAKCARTELFHQYLNEVPLIFFPPFYVNQAHYRLLIHKTLLYLTVQLTFNNKQDFIWKRCLYKFSINDGKGNLSNDGDQAYIKIRQCNGAHFLHFKEQFSSCRDTLQCQQSIADCHSQLHSPQTNTQKWPTK